MISLRLAKKGDCRILYNWRNHPMIRNTAFNDSEIDYESHKKWFLNSLKNIDRVIYIVSNEKKENIGQIRFDKITKKCSEIGIYLSPDYQGKGYGYETLRKGLIRYMDDYNINKIVAKVKKGNSPSSKLFLKAGFKKTKSKKDFSEYTYVKNYIISTIKKWNYDNFIELNKRYGYKLTLIKNHKDFTIKRIQTLNPRYIFFPHWSWKIPELVYSNYECIVFHMSDLPYGRGGSPLQNLIKMGHLKTKISALEVVKELDAGPIYLKENLSLHGSARQIYKRASEIIFRKMIPQIIEKRQIAKTQTGKPTVFKRRKEHESNILCLD